MRDGHTINGVYRWGWFYLFWTREHSPDAVTFGITHDPERRFVNYMLDDIELIGVWKFPTMADAEAYETNVKYRLTHSRAEPWLNRVVIPWDGRWTESCDPLCGHVIEEELDSAPDVRRMSDRVNGPWHRVSIETYLRNHHQGERITIPVTMGSRTSPLAWPGVQAKARVMASTESYPTLWIDILAGAIVQRWCGVDGVKEMILACVGSWGEVGLRVCQRVIDYYGVEL